MAVVNLGRSRKHHEIMGAAVDPGRQWKHHGFVNAAIDTGTSLEEMPCECQRYGWDDSLKHQQPYELIAFTQQDAC